MVLLEIPIDSVDPKDDVALIEATEKIIKKLQQKKQEWLKLTEDQWHEGCPKYMGIFNLIKRECMPTGKSR